jgi:outer membrane cobalamin receptor
LRQKLSLFFVLVFLCSPAFSQTPDSSFTTDLDSPDSLVHEDSLEEADAARPGRWTQADPFTDRLIRRFSLWKRVTAEDIDNSVGESVGDLLIMRGLVDVMAIGSPGQPEMAYFAGNMRGSDILIDGVPFYPQDLYFGQAGNLDLNSVPLSDVSQVQFLPAALANLRGRGAGILGVNVVTKDFDAPEPYSKFTANRGPYGFRRTAAELGRELFSKGEFYFTAEFKNAEGYPENADYDGTSLWGKTTWNLKRGMDFRLSAYHHQVKMGLPLFPGASFKDARKTKRNWGASGTLLLQQNIHALLSFRLRYEKRNQEIKSAAYGFENKKIEETIDLTSTQTLESSGRNELKIEGSVDRRTFRTLEGKKKILGGYLAVADAYQLTSRALLLLSSRVGKEEGLDVGISASGGISYSVTQGVDVFSTLGRFVGYPTLMDRFWPPFSIGLKDTIPDYGEEGRASIKPQKSWVIDLGANVEKEYYSIGGYLFGSVLDDFIFWSNVDTTVYYGHYRPTNSEAKVWGANINAEFDPLDHLSSYLSYSFKQSRHSDRKTQLAHSPEHSLFGYIQFEDEFLRREIGLKLRLETNLLSARFMDEYEQQREPAVAVVNAKVTVRFLDFHFHYIVRNITDQTYRLAGPYTMPERSFWWGFYWEFFD